MNASLGTALVFISFDMLFVGARFARSSGRLSAEGSRKLVHVGMGCICLTFPVMFASAGPVVVLGAMAATTLFAVRTIPALRARLGCVLHDVPRRSYGEFAFVGGVAAAFVLAHGAPLPYDVAVAVLTFADTAAALVGERFGARRFRTPGGAKSLEGSCAFLATAFACVAIGLRVAGAADPLPPAIAIAALLTALEATAWAGLDNFTIPVAGGALVRALTGGIGGGTF
jgi:phytol kinase